MLKLLEWFKLGKAPLVKHLDVDVIKWMEDMKEKASVRKSIRERTMVTGGLLNICLLLFILDVSFFWSLGYIKKLAFGCPWFCVLSIYGAM